MEESQIPLDFTSDLGVDLIHQEASDLEIMNSAEAESETEVISIENIPCPTLQVNQSIKENINIYIKEVIIRDERFSKYAIYHILVEII